MMVAGEASADLHGSRVIEALRRLDPEIRVYGMGSEHMRQAGAELIIDSSHLAVVGITEVFGRIGGLFRAYRNIKNFIKKNKLRLLILIDFPDFNLSLARVARVAGVPVLYYISPQVWAWRYGRVRKIAGRTDKMAVIFPFEVPIYQGAGLDVEFVGHPLLDVLTSQWAGICSFQPFAVQWRPADCPSSRESGKGDSVSVARDAEGRRYFSPAETGGEIHLAGRPGGKCSGIEKVLAPSFYPHCGGRRTNLRGDHGR